MISEHGNEFSITGPSWFDSIHIHFEIRVLSESHSMELDGNQWVTRASNVEFWCFIFEDSCLPMLLSTLVYWDKCRTYARLRTHQRNLNSLPSRVSYGVSAGAWKINDSPIKALTDIHNSILMENVFSFSLWFLVIRRQQNFAHARQHSCLVMFKIKCTLSEKGCDLMKMPSNLNQNEKVLKWTIVFTWKLCWFQLYPPRM